MLVSAGNIDSMVNHYTAAKTQIHDMYAPGGKGGMRPDRATLVYCNRIKEAFGSDMPILIGGIMQVLEDLLIMIIGTIRLDVRFCLTLVQVF